jgi:RNA polymerase sigma factor for flagellar operon FliA
MATRSRKPAQSPIDAARDTMAQARAIDDNGPLDGLDEADIVERYRGLCVKIVEQLRVLFALDRRHNDDMIADANLGLLEAWQRFEPVQGSAFSTFAYYRVKGAVIDGLRIRGTIPRRKRPRVILASAATDCGQSAPTARPTQQSRLQNLDNTIRTMSGAALLIYTREAEAEDTQRRRNPSAALLGAEVRQHLHDNLAALPDLDRRVLEGLYFKGESLRVLAEREGRSRSWLCRIHTRALRQLQQSMHPDDLHTDG